MIIEGKIQKSFFFLFKKIVYLKKSKNRSIWRESAKILAILQKSVSKVKILKFFRMSNIG